MAKTTLVKILLPIFFMIVTPLTIKAQEAEKTTNSPLTATYLIGAGDVLNVVVWKNIDLTDEYLVRPDGKFSIPLVGDIIAGGKTTDSINLQIEQKLKLFIETPYVNTIVTEPNSNVVYILGEVNTPGVYQVRGSLTVLQALALAGGFTEFAKLNEITVINHNTSDDRKKVVSYKEILRNPFDGKNVLLKRGDTVIVP